MSKYINYSYLDEDTKKEIRRAIIKAISIPGYIVPFASREMPISRGWGTGGLQITLTIIKEEDILKVIDQGSDDSVNAVILREFISSCSFCKTTKDTTKASIIQTRHRIPETPTTEEQILVFQVPYPDVLVTVEPDSYIQKKLHAFHDYSKLWILLFDDIFAVGDSRFTHRYPVRVNDGYVMDPSPIPRFDIPKLNNNKSLLLFGAGREKKIYAIPPYTKVEPLKFEDIEFKIELYEEIRCEKCGAKGVFFDIFEDSCGEKHYYCNDTDFCERNRYAYRSKRSK
ncbi:MAG: alpha-D-ribose 1-methylphosphonate 5-phosphate lyase [Desulfonauticus sp.]|jgi:alpha-D-ribose 1-methylphosphonate 5-phosphate C-P lyase|nr:alpha-D-ribose 1-methylphosphonate 5-phosphate lyase [Desulfonauticus sp.]